MVTGHTQAGWLGPAWWIASCGTWARTSIDYSGVPRSDTIYGVSAAIYQEHGMWACGACAIPLPQHRSGPVGLSNPPHLLSILPPPLPVRPCNSTPPIHRPVFIIAQCCQSPDPQAFLPQTDTPATCISPAPAPCTWHSIITSPAAALTALCNVAHSPSSSAIAAKQQNEGWQTTPGRHLQLAPPAICSLCQKSTKPNARFDVNHAFQP